MIHTRNTNKDNHMGLRCFHFERAKDISGVSGCGKVAEGCLFLDTGQVVVHWLGEHGSVNIYNSLEDVEYVHGHDGCTHIVFDDPQPAVEGGKKDGN